MNTELLKGKMFKSIRIDRAVKGESHDMVVFLDEDHIEYRLYNTHGHIFMTKTEGDILDILNNKIDSVLVAVNAEENIKIDDGMRIFTLAKSKVVVFSLCAGGHEVHFHWFVEKTDEILDNDFLGFRLEEWKLTQKQKLTIKSIGY